MEVSYTNDYIKTTGPLTVDFAKPCGRIKRELTSTNFAPTLSTGYASNKWFKELRSYSTRTHDLALYSWGQRIFDTKMMFPLEHRDPTDPSNYVFGPTDDFVANTYKQGTKIYFRLGTSIENTPRPFNAVSPKDYHHYAEICAGIIRHYTRGWANGYHYDMKYWEIFNECDCGVTEWTDTQEQFHEFFEIMVRRLKSEFPELKISGPVYCTYWADWMFPFLNYVKEHKVPLDFYSFHCYSRDVYLMVNVPFMMRRLLDSYGYKDAEIHITEWHPLLEDVGWWPEHEEHTPKMYEELVAGHSGYHGIDMAAKVASVIIGWHDAPIDQAHYYGNGRDSGQCDIFTMFNLYGRPNKKYFALKMVCDLACDTPARVSATGGDKQTWILAGTDKAKKHAQILLVDNASKATKFPINLPGIKTLKNAKITRVTHLSDGEDVPVNFKDGVLTLPKDYMYSAVYKISFDL